MKKLVKSVALIGFQSSGKTTLGRELAMRLQCAFVDLDQRIEQQHPLLSCYEIWTKLGSLDFRRLESQILADVKFQPAIVLATGGGSLLNSQNQATLKKETLLIYLKTSPEILKKRIWQRAKLPAYLDCRNPHQAFAAMYKEREPIYEQWADLWIEMEELSLFEVLEKIQKAIDFNLGQALPEFDYHFVGSNGIE